MKSPRKVLGISAYYHDASAALVVGGEVVAAAAEERFTRLKHDSNFPRFAIDFCLNEAELAPEELDRIVFYEDPYLKFTRVVASTLAGFPFSRIFFVRAMKEWLRSKLWLQYEISSELGIHPKTICFAKHHNSHLAQAFLTSPFEESAILTMDAVGEWICTSIGCGRRDKRDAVSPIESIPYPHSLGLAYAAFTAFLGLRPNDSEASTMALAAYGEPAYIDQVRQVINLEEDGTYRLNHRLFNFLSEDLRLFTPEFVALFGEPRDHRLAFPFDSLDDHFSDTEVTGDDRRFADIAASLQRVLEEAVLGLARRAFRLTGSKRLCIAGGVALNAVANSRVIEESGFEDVFIPPDPGDGGGAVGAALLEYYRLSAERPPVRIFPWLGQAHPAGSVESVLLHSAAEGWQEYRMDGCAGLEQGAVFSESFDTFEELADRVAQELESGRIVGWFQGRFELGPRALGNRSILADPANISCIRRLSQRVKSRAKFRPYALSIREEDAARVFEFNNTIPRCARWMQMVKPIHPEAEPMVRGAIHIDGTTRLQVCSAEDNPRFHLLLSAFAARRGLGALLNTSFNESGYPIVASPMEALLMFARTDMDILVVNRLMVRRIGNESQRGMDSVATEVALGVRQCAEINA